MLIEVKNLTKTYPNGVQALKQVSLALDSGVTGLLGPNGAGKSTLINLLVGLSRPTAGEILIDGVPLKAGKEKLLQSLGYLPQRFTPYPSLMVAEFLDYMAILKGLDQRAARIEAVLEAVHLKEYRKRRVSTLSGGMRQRLGIAQALLNDPQVLVLDEPTAGLDPEERLHFRNLLAGMAFHRTVLISSHIISDLSATCEKLLVLEHGSLLYDGSPETLRIRTNGRVWEVDVPAEEFDSFSRRTQVISSRKDGSLVRARIVAGPDGSQGGRPVEPSLEDAYISIRSEVA